jgi:hypothetical protein
MNDTLTLRQFARAMQDLRAGKYTGEEAAEINAMLDALVGAAAPWIAERITNGAVEQRALEALQQALAQASAGRVAMRADHRDEPAALRAARAEGAAAARRAIERAQFSAAPATEPVDPLAHLRMIRGPGEIVAAEQRMSAADGADAPLTFAERRDVDEALAMVRFSTSSHAHAEAARAAKEWRFLKARNLSSLSLRDYVETSVRRWAERTPHADY